MNSTVIVNWNSGPFLEKCILSLLKHAPDCEIIVVDNASEDHSLDFSTRLGSSLTVIQNPSNRGFAAASNQGWRASRGEAVLFLNPDTECLPGSLRRLEECLRSDPSICGVGGQLVGPSGKPQTGFNIRTFPTIGSVAADMLLLDEIWPGNPWTRRYLMSDQSHNSEMDVDQPAAACLMLRRSILESLDGFDEHFYPAWFEDVDLCKRIRGAGGRIRYEPAGSFLHHGGSSLRRLEYGKFLEFFHSNQIRYFAKHHGQSAASRVRVLITAGMCLRGIWSLFRPIPRHGSRLDSSRTFWSTARQFAAMREVGR